MPNSKLQLTVVDKQTVGGVDNVPVLLPNEPYKVKWAGTGSIIASGNTDANGQISVDLGQGRFVVDIYIDDVLKIQGLEYLGVEYG